MGIGAASPVGKRLSISGTVALPNRRHTGYQQRACPESARVFDAVVPQPPAFFEDASAARTWCRSATTGALDAIMPCSGALEDPVLRQDICRMDDQINA
jgi:hypothetical protein